MRRLETSTFSGKLATICFIIGLIAIVSGIICAADSAFGYFQTPEELWSHPRSFQISGVGFLGGFLISIPGAILVWIAGLKTRPFHLPKILVVIGAIYCLVFLAGGLVYITQNNFSSPDTSSGSAYAKALPGLIYLLPGVSCVVEGVIIRKINRDLRSDSGTI